jgi:hypothetical protein
LRKLNVSGADLQSEEGHPSILVGRFPPGSSWKTITVTLSW